MFFRWGRKKTEPESDVPTVLVERHEPRRRTEWPARDATVPPDPAEPHQRTMPPQPHDPAPDDERTRIASPGYRRGAARPPEPPMHDYHPRERTAPPQDRYAEEPVYHPPPHQAPPESFPPPEERTRLFRGPSAGSGSPGAAPEPAHRLADDPVVGWLVLVEGPGKGRSIEIGSGANSVGRSPGQQIRIDFGDDLISRERHAILIFDPRTQRFFLERGDGRNLTYVGDSPVLSPVELIGGETIILGKTQCRFVRLCGEDFSWT